MAQPFSLINLKVLYAAQVDINKMREARLND